MMRETWTVTTKQAGQIARHSSKRGTPHSVKGISSKSGRVVVSNGRVRIVPKKR